MVKVNISGSHCQAVRKGWGDQNQGRWHLRQNRCIRCKCALPLTGWVPFWLTDIVQYYLRVPGLLFSRTQFRIYHRRSSSVNQTDQTERQDRKGVTPWWSSGNTCIVCPNIRDRICLPAVATGWRMMSAMRLSLRLFGAVECDLRVPDMRAWEEFVSSRPLLGNESHSPQNGHYDTKIWHQK